MWHFLDPFAEFPSLLLPLSLSPSFVHDIRNAWMHVSSNSTVPSSSPPMLALSWLAGRLYSAGRDG